jgi:hypothetical protein
VLEAPVLPSPYTVPTQGTFEHGAQLGLAGAAESEKRGFYAWLAGRMELAGAMGTSGQETLCTAFKEGRFPRPNLRTGPSPHLCPNPNTLHPLLLPFPTLLNSLTLCLKVMTSRPGPGVLQCPSLESPLLSG